MPRADQEPVTGYADLIEDADGPAMRELVERLDAGLTAIEPPASLLRAIPRPLPRVPGDGTKARRRSSLPRRLVAFVSPPALGAIVLALVVAVNASGTPPNITNLGPPTDAQPPSYVPLGAFRRVRGLPTFAKPTLVFLGSLANELDLFGHSAAERWPVVKALDQFGTLTKVRPLNGVCRPFNNAQVCAVPTYNWSHASYRSTYLTFDHKDLIDFNARPYQRMTAQELALYRGLVYLPSTKLPYARQAGCVTPLKCVGFADSEGEMPLLVIGDYVQVASRLLVMGDFQHPSPQATATPLIQNPPMTGLTFDEVQSALASGKNPTPNSNLVEDVNAEANLITALICHADGKRPASVCGRPTIKAILKYVK